MRLRLRRTDASQMGQPFGLLLLLLLVLAGSATPSAFAAPPAPLPPDVDPAEAWALEYVESTYRADYLHLATGDALAEHATYDWPFDISFTLGHAIQSYQNYSSGTSEAYFHHGLDIMAPNGTDVFNRSGDSQVVNVENYRAQATSTGK